MDRLTAIKDRLARTLGRKPTSEELRTAYYLERPLDQWKELARADWAWRIRHAEIERTSLTTGP
jgi:hypothetical protein